MDKLLEQMHKSNEMRAIMPFQKRPVSPQKSDSFDLQEAERHYHLAQCYEEGTEGSEEDENKALAEYKTAAELGNTKAMIEIAWDYSDAEDSVLGYDLTKTEFWAKKAIELGNPDGYRCLSEVYEQRGNGEEAIRQLETGVSKGSHDCIEWLAYITYWGGNVGDYEVKIDEDRAFKLLRSVNWDNEHTLALETLGDLYSDKKDYNTAIQLYERVLNTDSEDYGTMAKLGAILANEKEVRDYGKAISLLHQAAQHDQLFAMTQLGVMLYYGNGIEKDEQAGIEWIRKAAQQGFLQAVFNNRYDNRYDNKYDILVETHIAEALYWLKRADLFKEADQAL